MLINAALICVTAACGTKYMSYKFKQNEAVQVQQSQELVTPVTKKTVKPRKRKSGSTVTLRKDQASGQFFTHARVNSGRVHFLVDTGASSVALTLNDAKKIGIKPRDLNYNVPISTAGGRNYAAIVTLDSISVGAITIRNVQAFVVPKGLEISLLGMTYLGELQKVEATRDTLFLRL